AIQELARHQRQQRPERAGSCKKQKSTQQYDMQLMTGTRITKPRTECPRKTFGECIVLLLWPRPPQQSGNDECIADDVHPINAAPAPPKNVSAISEVTVCRPATDKSARQRLTLPS